MWDFEEYMPAIVIAVVFLSFTDFTLTKRLLNFQLISGKFFYEASKPIWNICSAMLKRDRSETSIGEVEPPPVALFEKSFSIEM